MIDQWTKDAILKNIFETCDANMYEEVTRAVFAPSETYGIRKFENDILFEKHLYRVIFIEKLIFEDGDPFNVRDSEIVFCDIFLLC